MPAKIKKQAVVVIHGMGEQRPILTLRSLMESVAQYLRDIKKEARQNEAIFWDKPDNSSGNYETRRMNMREGRNHPTTHFYEFYWAHHMRDTNFSHIKAWLNRVVFRHPKNVSKRLVPVFWFVWILFMLTLAAVAVLIFRFGLSHTTQKLIGIPTTVVGTIVLGYLSHFLFNYLGDAARYLDPAPGNIGERQAIRSEGMALLKKLHDPKKEYDRIIIVSHSLGTAVAYDLIKLLWAEYYYEKNKDAFDKLTGEEKDLHFANLNQSIANAEALDGQPNALSAFRNSQSQSFDYLKAIGNPWRISDLVTIGSPLAHAGHLFAQEEGLFEKLKLQREYPTSPPYIQPPDMNWFIPSKPTTLEESMPRHFNHSSVFAATRWTNLYYNTDFIGGPVAPLFGEGIMDIMVDRGSGFFAFPGGHTSYWDFDNNKNILKQIWQILEDKEVSVD